MKQIKRNKATAIGYRGEVTATLCTKKKKKIKTIICHNEGTSLLFARLASVLAGNASQEMRQMPQYIDIGSNNDSGNFQSHLVQRVYITDGGRVSQESDGYSVTFGGIIQLANINSIFAKTEIDEVRLCSGGVIGTNDYLAKTTLSESVTLTETSSNLIISWKMYITNAETSSNSSASVSGGN